MLLHLAMRSIQVGPSKLLNPKLCLLLHTIVYLFMHYILNVYMLCRLFIDIAAWFKNGKKNISMIPHFFFRTSDNQQDICISWRGSCTPCLCYFSLPYLGLHSIPKSKYNPSKWFTFAKAAILISHQYHHQTHHVSQLLNFKKLFQGSIKLDTCA